MEKGEGEEGWEGDLLVDADAGDEDGDDADDGGEDLEPGPDGHEHHAHLHNRGRLLVRDVEDLHRPSPSDPSSPAEGGPTSLALMTK